MNRKKRAAVARRLLGEAAHDQLLARVYTRPAAKNDYLEGYVVGLSDEWVLLNNVDSDTMRANGYSAARVKDVTQVWLLRDRHNDVTGRALALRGVTAVPQPDLLLVDLPGLLSSADAHFPLVTVHLENKLPGTCYIGRVTKLTRKGAWLREITPAATWESAPTRYPLKHITRVAFGGGYEEALWQVSEHERQTTKNSEGLS